MTTYVERRHEFDFRSVLTIPASGSPGAGPFVQRIVDTAGTATALIAAGKLELTLDSDAEVESASIDTGDYDPILADRLNRIGFRFKGPVAAASDANNWFIGIGSEFNADPGAMAKHLFVGASDDDGELKLWAEDGSGVDMNAVATGVYFDPSNEIDVVFDFVEGIKSVAPPGASGGRWSDVHVYASGLPFASSSARTPKRRVLRSTSIDLSVCLGTGFNIFAMVKKASGATTPKLTVERIWYDYLQEAG